MPSNQEETGRSNESILDKLNKSQREQNQNIPLKMKKKQSETAEAITELSAFKRELLEAIPIRHREDLLKTLDLDLPM